MERNNGKSGNGMRFVFRFLTNGIWLFFQAIQLRLPKHYLYTLGGIAFVAYFLTWASNEEHMLLADSWWITWTVSYLVLCGLWMMYREQRAEKWADGIRMKVGDLEKVNETMPDERLLKENFDLQVLEKQWSNEEAFEHYEAIFPRLVSLAQELVPNEHNNIYALKDYIRWQKDRGEETRWRYDELLNEQRFDKNETAKSWLRKTAPYYEFSKPGFYDETIELVDRLQKERDSNRKGVLGERQVQRYLTGYENEFLPLYGNRFQSEDGTVENDVLLFTERGIYSLEIKNINAVGKQKLKITRDGQWFEWRKNEWVKSNNSKIFDQVNRHNLLTEKKLAEEFTNRREIEVKTIIVIPNDNVEILNESQFEIVRPSQIPAYIRNQPVRLAAEQALKMRTFMDEADIGQGKFPFLDTEACAEEIEKRIQVMRNMQTVFGYVVRIRENYNNACQNKVLQPLLYERFLNMRRDKLTI